MGITVVFLVLVVVYIATSFKIVPQQHAWIVERLGKYQGELQPGLNFIIPFIDRVSFKFDKREMPLQVKEQVCITRDNTQLTVDGIVYLQVTDARLAAYGTANYISAAIQLAQTSLRSQIGKMDLDQTFHERDAINMGVVLAINEAAINWGVQVLRYEILDLTPPQHIIDAMEKQITAEREKRALIASSEGRKQEQINVADGLKQAAIAKAEGEASAITAVADATAKAIKTVAEAISSQGGEKAVQLKVAEKAIESFAHVAADAKTTLIVPADMSNVSGLISAAMAMAQGAKT
jgi:regulator of protease activity HflC (stomatin/prohibitin superfamily)